MFTPRPRPDEARGRELAQREAPLRVLVRCDTTRFRNAEQQRAFGHVLRGVEAADAVSFFHGDVADKATFRFYPRRERVFRRARRRESACIRSGQQYGTLQLDHLNDCRRRCGRSGALAGAASNGLCGSSSRAALPASLTLRRTRTAIESMKIDQFQSLLAAASRFALSALGCCLLESYRH